MIPKCKGFTLVELAIVVVIIGLLVSGILQGQELIRQAKLQKIIKSYEESKAALNLFQGKYSCLPGDCATITNYLSGTINGNGNGLIEWSTNENLSVWQQLSKSNIIKGTYSNSGTMTGGLNVPSVYDNVVENFMANPSWNMYWTNSSGSGINHLVFGYVNPVIHPHNWQPIMKPEEAYGLDVKADDGFPGKGIIRVHSPNGSIVGSVQCSSTTDANTSVYLIGNNGMYCGIVFLIY